MSTAVNTKQKSLVQILDESRDQITKALPKVLSSERFIRVALTEVRKSTALQQCHPLSVVSCVMQAAQLGLEFGAVLGHAYMIPYKGEATLQIGYKGLIELVRRSGTITTLEARAVYDGDLFEYELGTSPKVTHKPSLNQKNAVAYYAVAKFSNGDTQFDVMSKEAVEDVRDRFSRAKDKDAWTKSFDEMAKKTVVRRLIKMLPISTEVADALGAEGDFETIEIPREPEKLTQVMEGQMQLTGPEAEIAKRNLEELYIKAEDLGIPIADLPDNNFNDQQNIATIEILKERIEAHATAEKNRAKN